VRRREFITLLGGAAAAWPLAAHAQQAERVRRIGILMAYAESDSVYQAYVKAFREGLQKLGWEEGRNIRFDYRWATSDLELIQRSAKELIALQPDLILSSSTPTTASLLRQTRTIPIIFANIFDPVASGFVASLSRPGGNATGYVILEPSMASKWPELLKEIAPRVNRIAILFNPATATFAEIFLKPFKAAAASFGVEAIVAPVNDRSDTSLTARYRLPAVYTYRIFAELGGLMSYGNDALDNYRRSAIYVDRILKGEKPSELPVQVPVKYELVINLKTAKTLGLTVPQTLLVAADELIE
jgi:putative tryptophan/tyrosine transport system substrate-binding protein